ncbi:MAG TPA: hypothetical protein VHR66_20775 [Gemmataceae bacterium]|jgi:hypothetical protein|nr:hypothetical protein [Gemmataceae bacterium]
MHQHPSGDTLDRRTFLQATALGLSGTRLCATPADGELLYNGIRLPAEWPPKWKYTLEPMPLPYLDNPPTVIPIDVGRQLFVDDFLISETTLTRTYHTAKYHAASPVLKPDQPWEQQNGPMAMVFSDGVWYDPKDRLFKMWYMGGQTRATCYATSKDGLQWEKPILDVKKDTNIVQPDPRDSVTVWLDHDEKDAKRRYKLFRSWRDKASSTGWNQTVYFSEDGIHWGEPLATSGPSGDRNTLFYNPFRKVWVWSVRTNDAKMGRTRGYIENADVLAGARWKNVNDPMPWVGADKFDPRRDDLKTQPQLYNLDCVAYESVLLGLFSIWRGQPNDRPKPNEVCAGFSRDGFHWHRPDHRAFIPVSEKHGDWNWGNVQSAGGCCLVVGDQLYFYVSGRAGVKGSTASGVSTTGLAVLRRDGFASMDAGEKEGTLLTRPVTFRGKHLFVNVAAEHGELRAEVLDKDNKIIPRLTRDNCVPVRVDSTRAAVTWKGADLAKLSGQAVRFRFHLKNGELYAFWASPADTGASHGYVAAGGPGFTGPIDSVGGKARVE